MNLTLDMKSLRYPLEIQAEGFSMLLNLSVRNPGGICGLEVCFGSHSTY